MSEERQTKYTIAESFELPSGGKVYDPAFNGMVELRSMTARDEMKRQSPGVARLKKNADLIEDCLIEKLPIKVYDLALGDYEFLLHKLRIVSYGGDYKIVTNCPHCGKQVEVVADLESLTIKDFDMETFESLRSFTLPKSGDSITIKVMTPRMLDEISNKVKELNRKFKDADVAFDDFVTLTKIIDTINGEKLDSTRIESYVNKLPVMDMLKIQNKLNELNEYIGIDTIMDVDCSECGNSFKTFFRFGPEFFRPTTI